MKSTHSTRVIQSQLELIAFFITSSFIFQLESERLMLISFWKLLLSNSSHIKSTRVIRLFWVNFIQHSSYIFSLEVIFNIKALKSLKSNSSYHSQYFEISKNFIITSRDLKATRVMEYTFTRVTWKSLEWWTISEAIFVSVSYSVN